MIELNSTLSSTLSNANPIDEIRKAENERLDALENCYKKILNEESDIYTSQSALKLFPTKKSTFKNLVESKRLEKICSPKKLHKSQAQQFQDKRIDKINSSSPWIYNSAIKTKGKNFGNQEPELVRSYKKGDDIVCEYCPNYQVKEIGNSRIDKIMLNESRRYENNQVNDSVYDELLQKENNIFGGGINLSNQKSNNKDLNNNNQFDYNNLKLNDNEHDDSYFANQKLESHDKGAFGLGTKLNTENFPIRHSNKTVSEFLADTGYERNHHHGKNPYDKFYSNGFDIGVEKENLNDNNDMESDVNHGRKIFQQNCRSLYI